MDKVVGLKELRTNIESYINAVEQGNSFLVVKRSKPVFKLTPVEDEEQWETIADFSKSKRGGVPLNEIGSRLDNTMIT